MPNKKDIKKLRKDWSEAEDHEFAQKLLMLDRDTRTTVVKEFGESFGFDYVVCRDNFQNIAHRGFGNYIKGSRGTNSRIEWISSPHEVANLILADTAARVEDAIASLSESHKGKRIWLWDEVVELLAQTSGVRQSEIVLDMKINEVKRNFSRLHGVDERDVNFSLGV